jgi:hypothetical protein
MSVNSKELPSSHLKSTPAAGGHVDTLDPVNSPLRIDIHRDVISPKQG